MARDFKCNANLEIKILKIVIHFVFKLLVYQYIIFLAAFTGLRDVNLNKQLITEIFLVKDRPKIL